MSEKSLSGGAAERDITPEPGIQLAGTIGFRRPRRIGSRPVVCPRPRSRTEWVEGVPPVARPLGRSHGLVRHHSQARGSCHRRLGVTSYLARNTEPLGPLHRVLFLPRRLHAGPNDMEWLLGGDDRYNEPAIERIVKAAEVARDRLEPVSFGVGSTFDGRIGFNRPTGTPGWNRPNGASASGRCAPVADRGPDRSRSRRRGISLGSDG